MPAAKPIDWNFNLKIGLSSNIIWKLKPSTLMNGIKHLEFMNCNLPIERFPSLIGKKFLVNSVHNLLEALSTIVEGKFCEFHLLNPQRYDEASCSVMVTFNYFKTLKNPP